MPDVIFDDLMRAIDERAPDFASLVTAYLEQPDPPEDRPEIEADVRDDPETERRPLADGTWTLERLRTAISEQRLAEKTPTEQKNIRREAFEGLLAAPYPPPRLRLGAMLVGLYDRGDEWSRAQLLSIFVHGRLGFGVWQAFKRVYKRAEADHDAEMFGALAYRLDAFALTPHNKGEIGPGTITYMRRRAWRYLRQLGAAVPDVYPVFAAQVLRHYPAGFRFRGSWVANQIWAHRELAGKRSAKLALRAEPGGPASRARHPALGGDGTSPDGPPDDLEARAFDAAWKVSPDPLLRLIEDAKNEAVCDFAIRSLRRDFPERLRAIDIGWLRRIGRKRLETVDQFLVELLTDSPEFHQSRLEALGLHRAVLELLMSDSHAARSYAIRYAHAHAPDIEIEELVTLVQHGKAEVKELAIQRLADRPADAIGLDPLIGMLRVPEAQEMVEVKLRQGYRPADLTAEQYVRLAVGVRQQRNFVAEWFEMTKTPVPVGHLLRVVEHEDADRRAQQAAFQRLDERAGEEIGADWFKRALLVPALSGRASRWLREGKLSGDALDVEWLKGLVMRPALRSLALDVLNDRKLVAPRRIGLGWLLAMVRHPDEAVNQFAHAYLLENFTPDDFEGIDRIWSLASSKDEPDAVRRFAATYLKVHHPELGPTTPDAVQLGVKPRLGHEAYALERVRPLLEDERPQVRSLGVAFARYELVRWDDRRLLYDLAASGFREPRTFAAEVLMNVGDPMADPARVPPEDWLDAAQIFALAESRIRGTREIALNLILEHYETVGGPRRLAWLMESPDREVRAFAVRLLWQRHRPRATPVEWSPKKGQGVPGARERFESLDALRLFLRTALFGLPPGRGAQRDGGQPSLSRPLPASVAKRRLIEVVRDMALEDVRFAEMAAPVLETFVHSVGKGEWQACLTALARIRKAHPSLEVMLPGRSPAEAR